MSDHPGHVCGRHPGPWALRFPEWCRGDFHVGHFGCCCSVLRGAITEHLTSESEPEPEWMRLFP